MVKFRRAYLLSLMKPPFKLFLLNFFLRFIKGQLKESASPKRVIGQLGATSQLYTNKSQMKEIEKLQKVATTWILNE